MIVNSWQDYFINTNGFIVNARRLERKVRNYMNNPVTEIYTYGMRTYIRMVHVFYITYASRYTGNGSLS